MNDPVAQAMLLLIGMTVFQFATASMTLLVKAHSRGKNASYHVVAMVFTMVFTLLAVWLVSVALGGTL